MGYDTMRSTSSGIVVVVTNYTIVSGPAAQSADGYPDNFSGAQHSALGTRNTLGTAELAYDLSLRGGNGAPSVAVTVATLTPRAHV